MRLRRVFVGSVSVLALAGLAAPALAADEGVETVVVTGIRASMQRAMDIKRDATTMVDAVSAEDIGKFPDKNVADALQRVPGVNTVSAAGGEGGFDENDRVTIRGTNSSLTQVLIDGHTVSTGDWFILDQYQAVGRSVSFTLLPSEIVNSLSVYKSQQANLVEGGVAGVVNIVTRKPLDLKDNFTLEASAEGAYTMLRDRVTPQFNGLLGWKSDNGEFGVIVQGFYEARNTRRDGQEMLGYQQVGAASTAQCPAGKNCTGKDANGNTVPITGTPVLVDAGTNPALVGLYYPTTVGSALFLQQRVRMGGSVTLQYQPSDAVEVDVEGFYSHLGASNINENYMLWGLKEFSTNKPTSYTLTNNVITGATFNATNAAGNPAIAVVADSILRPGAGSQTYYLNGHSKMDVNNDLSLDFVAGYTQGLGKTKPQVAWEGVAYPTSTASYNLTSSGVYSVSMPGLDSSNPANLTNANGWAWTVVELSSDHEVYGQVDATEKVQIGPINTVQAGARYAEHKRKVLEYNSGVTYGDLGSDILTGHYPSDYADSFKVPGMLTNLPVANPALVEKLLYNTCTDTTKCSNPFPTAGHGWHNYPQSVAGVMDPNNYRLNYADSMGLTEDDLALYAMANMGGENWKGNFGVRVVKTSEMVGVYGNGISDPNNSTGCLLGTYEAFGCYVINKTSHNYWDILPSINISINLNDDSMLRFAAAETMARPDYSALGGSVSLNDTLQTGTGGNPNLKPIRSANYDVSYEWYYGPQSMFAVSLFYMDISSYVGYGTHQGSYVDMYLTGQSPTPVYATYTITSPVNSSGHTEGMEFQWEQPVYGGFGFQSNFTYASGVDSSGGPLVGDSKVTANLSAYYENSWLSARLAYTYRSKMLVGLDRSANEYQNATDSLDASVKYTVNDNIALTFDALNITDRKLRYTQAIPNAANTGFTNMPRAIYDNGGTLYAGIQVKY